MIGLGREMLRTIQRETGVVVVVVVVMVVAVMFTMTRRAAVIVVVLGTMVMGRLSMRARRVRARGWDMGRGGG